MAVVKSIVDIVVNDERFKAFAASFDKYQAALKKSGLQWSASEKAAAAVALSSKESTEELEKQRDELEKLEKAKQAAAEKERERRRRQWEQTKKNLKEEAQLVASLAKTAIGGVAQLAEGLGIGTILSGLMGAGGLFGLDRLAQNVGDQRRRAQGYGTTAQNAKALNLNFQRYFDTDSVLQNISEAQASPGRAGDFMALGIQDYQNKDPAQLAIEAALRAKQMVGKGPINMSYVHGARLDKFFSLEDLRRLQQSSESDIVKARGQFGQDVTHGVTDEAQKKFQDFAIEMDRAKMKIEMAFVDGLTPIIPQLKDLSKAISDAIVIFISNPHFKDWMKEFGEGLKQVAEYVGSAKFQDDVKTFTTDFALVAESVANALKFLGIIPKDNPKGGEGGISSTTQFGGAGHEVNDNFSMGGADKDQKTRALQFFMSKGWSKAQAAGIVANLDAESGLSAHPVGWNDGGKAHGVAQWHGERWKHLKEWAAKNKRDPNDLATQMDYFNYELSEGDMKAAGAKLRKQTTAAGAGDVVSRYDERPAAREQAAAARGKAAQQIYITLKSDVPVSPSMQGAKAAAQ